MQHIHPKYNSDFIWKCVFSLFVSLAVTTSVIGQLNITPSNQEPYNPMNLITNELVGDGIIINTISFPSDPESLGYFNTGLNKIGIESGLVLSTGLVKNIPGTNASTNFGSPQDSPLETDPDLEMLAGNLVTDISMFELEFVPLGDSISLRFVFASEEFPEFSCGGFNDVFGVFLSGPDINDVFSNNAKNIALLPDGVTPVSIETIHPAYTDPDSGDFCPASNVGFYNENPINATLQFNGFLNVLEIKQAVTPCATYNIKIAIGDAGKTDGFPDNVIDSGVFLEAGSLKSNAPSSELSANSQNGIIQEDCDPAEITVNLNFPSNLPTVIPYTTGGTATITSDYSLSSPGFIEIPAGSTSASLFITPLEDGMTEADEEVWVAMNINACVADTFFFLIEDNNLVQPDLGEDVSICRGDSVQLYQSFVPVNSTDLIFENPNDIIIDNAPSLGPSNLAVSSIEVTNVVPQRLGPGVIKSVCFTIEHAFSGDLSILLRAPNGSFVELSSDNGESINGYDICFVDDLSVDLFVQPGETLPQPTGVSMFTGTFRPEGEWANLWKLPSLTNGTWELLVFDDNGSDSFFGNIIDNFEITFFPPQQVDYQYDNLTGLTCDECADPYAKPLTNTTYTLTATDNNGCTKTDEINIGVIDTIRPPVPFCSSNSPNEILLRWDRSEAATDYLVSFNHTATTDTIWVAGNLADTAHRFSNLDPGQVLNIGLRPVGDCITKDTFFTCVVEACDPPMIVLDSFHMPSCNGFNDGRIFTSATSAISNSFNYSISQGGNFITISSNGAFGSLEAGEYEIVVADEFVCTDTLMVTIPEPDALTTQANIVNEPRCPGDANARGIVAVSGGTSPYEFLWTGGTTSAGLEGARAGKFYVTVTDANDCVTIDSLTFTDPVGYTIETDSTKVSCGGAMDGTATAIPMNGVAPYRYLWDSSTGSQMTATASGLSGGSYTVFVTDDNGCIEDATVIVEEEQVLDAILVAIPATCDGIDDGEVSITEITGGVAPFNILWNDANASTDMVLTGLAVGDYTVTITDSENCPVTRTESVTSPPAMMVMVTKDSVSCSGGSDGGASLVVSGGAGGYMYEWSDGGPTTADRTGLTSGINTVTITDMNMCRLIEPIDIPSQNPIFTDIDSTAVTCPGGADGTITLMASGGVAPLRYLWDDAASSTTSSLTNLTAGIYRVTVTDANDCFVIDSSQVTENEPLDLSPMSVDIDCFGDGGGTASVVVGGSQTIDSYQWNDPGNQTTATAAGLDGGTFKVILTYSGMCLDSLEVSVFEPEELMVTIDKSDIACFGETNGSATAVVTGGTGPYQYTWSDLLNQDQQTAVQLRAGGYSVSVTDANMCDAMGMTTINEPVELFVGNASSLPVICPDTPTGMAFFTPDGGTAPYSYAWSDGGAMDSLRSDLLPQKYFITVTDASNCSIIDSVEILNKAALVLTTDSVVVTCFEGADGQAIVEATGGNGGYMYEWDDDLMQTSRAAQFIPAGTYGITVTDALMCTIDTTVEVTQNPKINITGEAVDLACFNDDSGFVESNANGGVGNLTYSWNDDLNSTTQDLMNLSAGDYVVTVTDALMCFDTLRFVVGEPDTLAATFSIDGLLCFGDDIGSITANITGGNTNYMYQWDDPMSQTTATATGLMEGLYALTVTDSRNCTVMDTVRLVEPEALTLALDGTNILCNGDATGTINSTVGGGTPGYNYSYTGGSTVADPSLLTAGRYVLTVTDDNGCIIRDSIDITEPTAVDIQAMVSDIDCFGNVNGAIDISTSGGVMPYSYNWSSGQVVDDITGLSAGPYTLTVTDGNNCDNLKTEVVASPSEIQSTINAGPVLCFGDATGSASASVNGGTGDYVYTWSEGGMTSAISNLASGKYYLTIEDENGCIQLDSTEITQPMEALTASEMTMDLQCFGDANGVIDIDASGGTGPYRYLLDNRPLSNNSIFQGLSGGTYDVEVIDQNGCVFPIRDLVLFEPNEFIVDLGGNQIIELGVDTFQFDPIVSGGQGILSYEYSGLDLSNLTCVDCPDPFVQGQVFVKEYMLTVTDEEGCTAEDFITVIISKDRRIWVPTGFTPNGDTGNDILTPLGDPNTTVLDFQIFDRWGTLIYEQADFQLGDDNFGWDGTYRGKPLDPSVFVWKAKVVYLEDGVEESFTGQTYLLR